MGDYPAYSAYKASKIKWLEVLPIHWDEAKIRFFYDVQLGKMLQPEPTRPDDEETPYLKAFHVQWSKVEVNDLPTMWVSVTEKRKYSAINGDLLICEGGEAGRTALLTDLAGDCIIQNALHRVRGSDRATVHYLKYLMRHIAEAGWFDILCNKATIAHLTGEKLGAVELPLPSMEEQQAIARFLDSKTAQIDALIAKKEALLAKLAEKRTALISQAVTRGLDPTAPMKDSGIPWLGEIPAHWEPKRLKFISPEQSVGVVVNPSSYVDDNGTVPFIYGANIREYSIDGVSARRITEESNQILSKSRLNAGDLVVVRVGAPGVTAVVPLELDKCNCASVMFVRQHASFISEWLCHAFNARVGRFQVELVQYGAAQKQFNIEHAVNFVFPVPPIEEQNRIVTFIAEQLAPLGSIEKSTQQAIDKLKEYRTALITAAVTGKIDVRSLPTASPPIFPEMEAEYA